MFILVKNADIYEPCYSGRKDMLICNDRIIRISDSIDPPKGFETEMLDGTGLKAVPGFIDQHVHISGGGGEGGPATRTPDIRLTELTTAGITTVVGLLGTDGITRSMEALLTKARALEEEGITTYIYSGCYTLPFNTLTGSVQSDLILIDKVIGVGEIAIADHRSSYPSLEELKTLAAHTRVGGLLSKKAGIVHLHLGEGDEGIGAVIEIIHTTGIPASQFMPTHINRLSRLADQSMELLRMGGYVDLTSSFYKTEDHPYCMSIGDALKLYIENDIPLDHVCASSDANGSMPVFGENEVLISIDIGRADSLYKDIRSAIKDRGITLEQGLSLITINPAKALKLYPRKGILKEGSDADIVMLDSELNIHTVIAKGKIMVRDSEAVAKGFFER
ncbi:MAG TPA: beta-aspartyl-peptidase [Negativicutes bacterium]|nr:beta-aspartyl-peptidase [Negativicutes bacterium]